MKILLRATIKKEIIRKDNLFFYGSNSLFDDAVGGSNSRVRTEAAVSRSEASNIEQSDEASGSWD